MSQSPSMRPQRRAAGLTPTETHEPGSNAPSRYRVVVIDGSTSTRTPLPLDRALVVGRSPEADIRLEDARCSRFHARIDATGSAVIVTDLGSHNGTRKNGVAIGREPVVVRLGDSIEIGSALLVVHAADAPSAVILEGLDGERHVATDIDHALVYGGRAALLALRVPGGDEAAIMATLVRELRPLDVLARTRDDAWLVLAPDLDATGCEALARRLLGVISALVPEARVGLASAPDDGVRGEVIVAAALAASIGAASGTLALVRTSVGEWQAGGVTHVVADPIMIQTLHYVRRLAAARMPVLVEGETGAGKEGIARLIHEASPRAGGPFVAFSCAAMPEDLVESELFGHERGAFTGAVRSKPGLIEMADKGTLFLDEIGELSPRAQATFLRVLETGQLRRVGDVHERAVDFRVVAATHRDLEQLADAGAFRRDLLFRLSGATVHVPPLRERPRDLPVLARRFVDVSSPSPRRLAPATLSTLARYAWPGNVRELKFAIEFALAQSDAELLLPEHLPARVQRDSRATPTTTMSTAVAPTIAPDTNVTRASTAVAHAVPLADELEALETQRIHEALQATGGNQSAAARLLGMPRRTFVARIKKLGLQR